MARLYQPGAWRHRAPMVPNIVVLGRGGRVDVAERIMPYVDLGTASAARRMQRSIACPRFDWPSFGRSTDRLVPTGFVLMTIAVIWKFVLTPNGSASTRACTPRRTAAWVDGSDPWSVSAGGDLLRGPTTDALAFLPFVWMPPARRESRSGSWARSRWPTWRSAACVFRSGGLHSRLSWTPPWSATRMSRSWPCSSWPAAGSGSRAVPEDLRPRYRWW